MEAPKEGWKKAVVIPVKHLLMQAAMKTHLSQSTGAGAFEGQQGMSSAIVPDMAEACM